MALMLYFYCIYIKMADKQVAVWIDKFCPQKTKIVNIGCLLCELLLWIMETNIPVKARDTKVYHYRPPEMRMNGIEWGVGQESAISLSYQYFRKPFRVNGEIVRRTSERDWCGIQDNIPRSKESDSFSQRSRLIKVDNIIMTYKFCQSLMTPPISAQSANHP